MIVAQSQNRTGLINFSIQTYLHYLCGMISAKSKDIFVNYRQFKIQNGKNLGGNRIENAD
ncbi:hypothetical protein [Nostoc sp.]|uniref:hypothetical protein n=1 Tax=Nostoc sp. TaxID=1180 RepID=UPI002FF61316